MGSNIIVAFDVTFNQNTYWGDLLQRILYGNSDRLNLLDGWTGCPHHGGEHSLSVRDTKENLLTWFEMIEEDFPHHKGLEIVKFIKEELQRNSSKKRLVLKRLIPDSQSWIDQFMDDRRNRFARKVINNSKSGK